MYCYQDDIYTYTSQSTASNNPISCTGRPAAVRTKTRVTRPPSGTLAAPIAAATEMILKNNKCIKNV